jgi:hypothetical protein
MDIGEYIMVGNFGHSLLTVVLRTRSKTATVNMGLFISELTRPFTNAHIVPQNMSTEKPKNMFSPES